MSTPRISVLRSAGRALLLVLAFMVPPIAALVGNAIARMSDAMKPPLVPPAAIVEVIPEPDPRMRTAVVVTGNGGAEMSDFLIPYEVLATTGAFQMFVVAPEHRVVPLANAWSPDGGMELLPHFSLDEYDAEVGRAPDVIVIPYLPQFANGREQALVPWIQEQAARGSLVVSICAGAEVLAATGLADGQRATTHPSFFDRLEKSRPEVTWVRDVRYVEGERAISSGPIATGADATLAAVRRLLGRPAADRVASQLGYAHARFLDDPASPIGPLHAGVVLASALRPTATTAVLLDDGVSEIALGSILDTYPTTSGERLVTVAPERRVIASKHGLQILPRASFDTTPSVARVLVPGAPRPEILSAATTWATQRGAPVIRLHEGAEGFAYDAALRDIARRDGQIVARAVGHNLAYPTSHLTLEGPALPLDAIVRPLALGVAGLALALALTSRRRTRPARPETDASSSGPLSETEMAGPVSSSPMFPIERPSRI